jgi:redox-sensitive bicupin YhaK (pirin superfamily)
MRPSVEIVPVDALSSIEQGQTRAQVTGDAEATRGLRPDDIEWLASGISPGPTRHLDMWPLLLAAEQEIPPGGGYAMHPHHELETVTIVLGGSYLHETEHGDRALVSAGDVAVVSTGRGGAHQETTQPGAPLRSIMMWARSNTPDGEPAFAHRAFPDRVNRLVTVVSGSGAAGALAINAGIEVLAGKLDRGATVACDLGRARGYVIPTDGAIEIEGAVARPGERALVKGEFELRAIEPTEVVVVAA